jgi:mRNA-degrading endonuclease YafQ of YafQ-DinJ toxin-antitoxin module
MKKYSLIFSKLFLDKIQRLSKINLKLAKKVDKVLQLLEIDPKSPSLHSHQVNAKNFGRAWSSSVTGDIRIIWSYDQRNKLVILVLTLGSHSGHDKVYK